MLKTFELLWYIKVGKRPDNLVRDGSFSLQLMANHSTIKSSFLPFFFFLPLNCFKANIFFFFKCGIGITWMTSLKYVPGPHHRPTESQFLRVGHQNFAYLIRATACIL